MADNNTTLTVAEMRRRRQQREALENRVKDLTDALVVSTRKAAQEAAAEKLAADQEAAEALAVAVRLYGSAQTVADLTAIPVEEVQRAVRPIAAGRVNELLENIQFDAEEKLKKRSGRRPAKTTTDAPAGAAPAVPGQAGAASEDAPAETAPAASAS